MTNQPPFEVTTTITELTDGLTAGETYRAQHVGGVEVLYCNYATQPDANTDVSWNVMRTYENILFDADSANPVWVRTRQDTASLAISEQS